MNKVTLSEPLKAKQKQALVCFFPKIHTDAKQNRKKIHLRNEFSWTIKQSLFSPSLRQETSAQHVLPEHGRRNQIFSCGQGNVFTGACLSLGGGWDGERGMWWKGAMIDTTPRPTGGHWSNCKSNTLLSELVRHVLLRRSLSFCSCTT